jgi:cell division GTPase FtsZ
MNILLLSLGGGGGNILRSVKTLFLRDLAISRAADPAYAERLAAGVATRFLDTNQFSLMDVPQEERLLIGAQTTGHLGSRHNPTIAQRAFEESRDEIDALMSRYSTVIILATGGKGTGSGTIVPAALLARHQKKMVIPIFVRPSFEWHEVEKPRFDHALAIAEQFDAAGIRFIEILNDRGYSEADPQPQSVVWERMNVPIARALRGLLYVLWDLSQIDPSDLSALFGGRGRLQLGFAEIDPAAESDPTDAQIEDAVRRCANNPFCNFHPPTGTSLVCIQGEWSNVVDAKIKGRLSSAVTRDAPSPYNPLYARAFHLPKPWGVTTLFSEFTGKHEPADIHWSLDTPAEGKRPQEEQNVRVPPAQAVARRIAVTREAPALTSLADATPTYATFWDLALAVNRLQPAALAMAQNGADSSIPIDPWELKKLLGTLWFRSVFPRLSTVWRERLLRALVDHAVLPNHIIRVGRRDMRVSDLTHAQLKDLYSKLSLSEKVRADLRFAMTVGNLWGPESLREFRFAEPEQTVHS